MGTERESEVSIFLTTDVELLGIVEQRWIPVGRPDHRCQKLAPPNVKTANLYVGRGTPARRLNRRIETEKLFDGADNALRFRSQALVLARVLQQRQNAVA